MSTYWEKLRDPRWQQMRLRVMEAAGRRESASRGWSFGLHADGGAYRATAKCGEQIARATGPEPLETLARVMIEVQTLEAKA